MLARQNLILFSKKIYKQILPFFEIGNVTENHEVFCGKDLDLLPDWRTFITHRAWLLNNLFLRELLHSSGHNQNHPKLLSYFWISDEKISVSTQRQLAVSLGLVHAVFF